MYTLTVDPAGDWLRYRFWMPVEDYRPAYWPPPGPYWCSGIREGAEGNDEHCLIALVRPGSDLRHWWPEAIDIEDADLCEGLTFTSRFPQPSWLILKETTE